jgi:hypothetical protein
MTGGYSKLTMQFDSARNHAHESAPISLKNSRTSPRKAACRSSQSAVRRWAARQNLTYRFFDHSASTTCLSSTKLICVEPHQAMPHISIIGVRTDHLVNARPASPLCISFDLGGPPARSRPSASWVDCITSIGVLVFLHPSGEQGCTPAIMTTSRALAE